MVAINTLPMVAAALLPPVSPGLSAAREAMHAAPHAAQQRHPRLSRRGLLPLVAFAPLPLGARPAGAAPGAAPDLSTFTDSEYAVSFALPAGWKASESELSGATRRARCVPV